VTPEECLLASHSMSVSDKSTAAHLHLVHVLLDLLTILILEQQPVLPGRSRPGSERHRYPSRLHNRRTQLSAAVAVALANSQHPHRLRLSLSLSLKSLFRRRNLSLDSHPRRKLGRRSPHSLMLLLLMEMLLLLLLMMKTVLVVVMVIPGSSLGG
jgi:hypothetical protein